MRHPILKLMPLCLSLLLPAACAKLDKNAALKQGMADAKAAFADVKNHPNQEAELDALATNNLPVALFVTRHLPPDPAFKNYQANPGPWTIVVRGTGNGHYTLEAYAEDANTPVSREDVSTN